jgi:protein SCO1/2
MRYSLGMTRSIATLFLLLALTACGRGEMRPGVTDISGVMPDLKFAMVRANDGAFVTQDSYRGKVVLLYFGYTHCPDVCPATLSNLADVLKDLGPRASGVRVLFVSVDPVRDTLPELKSYVTAFAPQIDGLRGSPNAIARLAQRYRVLYSVKMTPHGEEVMHSGSVFFFDGKGKAREVMIQTNDMGGVAKDVLRMANE